jgi:hypothetical protein
MLPAVASPVVVGRRMLGYTVALWACTLVLVPVAGLGWIYTVTAVVLGALFVGGCLGLLREPTARRSMQVFAFSISYVTILFSALALDVPVRSAGDATVPAATIEDFGPGREPGNVPPTSDLAASAAGAVRREVAHDGHET